MASDYRPVERSARKLTKKRKDLRRVSLDIPERFRDAADADEDFAAPKHNNAISMHQSIFSMVTRAGQQSQTDLGATAEVDSGESDDDTRRNIQYNNLDGAARMSRLSSVHDFQSPIEGVEDGRVTKGKHRRALSEHRLLRSLPKLRKPSRKESRTEAQGEDLMSSSQFLPPPRPSKEEPSSPSPDESLSRNKTKTTSDRDLSVEKQQSSERKGKAGSITGGSKGKTTVSLANRLQQIFEFEDLEEVISGMLNKRCDRLMLICAEYPCWLLQSILLQGYMYITQKHICFYAYIPKKHVRIMLYILNPL